MEIKKVGNTYRKKKWYEQHEMLAYILLAIVFWAVILAAYFI